MKALLLLFYCFFSFIAFSQPVNSFEDRNTGFIGFKNENDEIIIPADKFQRWNRGNNREADMIMVSKDGKWGFCDLRGNIVIPLIYEKLDFFYEGLALAAITKGQYGYINRSGKVVIAFKYSNGNDFQEGWAPVQLGGKYGYIDKKGNTVLEHKYEYARPFKEGFASVAIGRSWGFIDRTGKEICEIKYENVKSFSDGLAVVRVGESYGFINRSGKEIIEPRYDYMNSFKEGMATVIVGKKYSFIDRSGKQIIEPLYDVIADFNGGFARVKTGYRWGFIDKKGKVILQPSFPDLWDFEDGFARVVVSTDFICDGRLRCSYINTKGEFITSKHYSTRSGDFKDGLAVVDHCYLGTKGVIDGTGREIIEAKYKSISISLGVITAIDKNGKEFRLNRLGNPVDDLNYQGSYFESLDVAHELMAEQLLAAVKFNGRNFYDSANLKAVNSYLDYAFNLTTLTTYVDKLLRNAAKNIKSYRDFSSYLYNRYTKPVPACYKAIAIHIALDHLCNVNAPYGGAYWIDKIELDQICEIAKKSKPAPCN
jgi:WG containing repeat